MATRVPPRKKAKRPERRSNAEGIIELLREMGPRTELADAIEKVYEERHRNPSSSSPGRLRARTSSLRTSAADRPLADAEIAEGIHRATRMPVRSR